MENRELNAPGPVHRKPVEAQLPHCIDELVEVDRLADVAVGTQVIAFDNIPLFI